MSLRRQQLPVTRWWALMVICASMVTLAVMGIAYTSHVDHQRAEFEQRARVEAERAEREADRRWCLLLTSLNRAYQSNTPISQLGVEVAVAVQQLTRALGCPER